MLVTHSNRITILPGDGSGNFLSNTTITGFSGAGFVAVADFNQDAWMDFALSVGGNQILVYQNNRVGGFLPPNVLAFPTGDIQAEDLNADGFMDLVTTNTGSGGIVTVIFGDGAGMFPESRAFATNSPAHRVALGDFDLTGSPDLAVRTRVSLFTRRLEVLLNGDPNAAFETPRGDYSTLTENTDGTFTRALKNGTQINFDANGFQTSKVNRNGNTTAYEYLQERLDKITDPAGLETTFTYTGSHLSSITDPAGRTTSFEHLNGDLVKITDPDQTFREFSYDDTHRLRTQTSKRGLVTQYEYGSGGRHVKALRPDGSTREVVPAQILSTGDLANGIGTTTSPVPLVRPNEVVSTITDGKGNIRSANTELLGSDSI